MGEASCRTCQGWHVLLAIPAAHPRPSPAPCRLLIATLLSYLGGKLATKQEIRQYPTHSSQVGGQFGRPAADACVPFEGSV